MKTLAAVLATLALVAVPVFAADFQGQPKGGLTNTELRATPVPVQGPVTDTQLRAAPVPVSQSAPIYAAAVPSKITLAGTASGSVTLTAGACIRVSCNTAASYRVGTGAQTAVADDNQLPANTVEVFCLGSTQTVVAFYTAAAGACYVAVVPQVP